MKEEVREGVAVRGEDVVAFEGTQEEITRIREVRTMAEGIEAEEEEHRATERRMGQINNRNHKPLVTAHHILPQISTSPTRIPTHLFLQTLERSYMQWHSWQHLLACSR